MRKLLASIFKFFWGRKKLSLVLIVVLGVVGYFLKGRFFPSADGFEIAKVERGLVREELILSGEIKAEQHASLTFQTSGELDYVGVSEGDVVAEGDLLARLDTNNLYQAYLQAESTLRNYQAVLDRVYDDVKGRDKDETLSQKEDRTQAEVNKDNAYRALVIAKKNLANAGIVAPFGGVVTRVAHPFSGLNTTLAESQIEIVNLETVYFEVSADQSEVTDISIGQKVAVVLDSFSSEEYGGEVEYVGWTPKPSEAGAIYVVKVKFNNISSDTSKFRIGMTGDAKFVLDEVEDVLFVPTQFVNVDAKGTYVNLGKTSNKVYVETGLEGEERVEVRGDVKEGNVIYD